jgi:alpha-galactosidase
MAAVSGRGPLTTDVSVPNVGQVDGIERGAVVEANAAIRAGEIRPLPSGGFPRSLRSLISTHLDTIETVIEASRGGDGREPPERASGRAMRGRPKGGLEQTKGEQSQP